MSARTSSWQAPQVKAALALAQGETKGVEDSLRAGIRYQSNSRLPSTLTVCQDPSFPQTCFPLPTLLAAHSQGSLSVSTEEAPNASQEAGDTINSWKSLSQNWVQESLL